MKPKITIYAVLILITIFAGILRFYNFTSNPPSLNIDEVSFGYSAYSILKTAHDDNGVFMPITFKSTGDYKNPIPTYLMVPSIWLFGLNEFGVRFPTALLGTLAIPIFFALLKYLLKKDWIALSGSFLIAISAWHIHFSRYAYDPLLGCFFLTIGILFFIKMITGVKYSAIFSAFFLVISMYSAFTERLFVPLFIFLGLCLNYKFVLKNKRVIFVFISLSSILVAPLVYATLFGAASTRLGMIFLTQDIEYTRYVILDHIFKSGEIFMALFFWIKRYLNYLQPDFLFFTGLNLTSSGTLGLGVLYLFEAPLFILGLIDLIKNNYSWKNTLLLWLFLGIFPASLANNDMSEGRSLIVLPAFLIVITLGLVYAFKLYISFKSKIFKFLISAVFIGLVIINLTQALLIFTIHFPKEKGEDFMEGSKESVLYAINHKNEYKEIVYDPYRGIQAPYIVNIPHMYILFYSNYDPAQYQIESKRFSSEGAHFDKYTIRSINWPIDGNKKGTLFIGSPWSVPDSDASHVKILKKIYLSSGELALIVATPI